MKLEINISDNTLFSIGIVGLVCVLITLIIAIWQYNTYVVEKYTLHGYEEISDKGTGLVYWRKAK